MSSISIHFNWPLINFIFMLMHRRWWWCIKNQPKPHRTT